MPPPKYRQTRILRVEAAWELLGGDPSWELAERLPGNKVVVGTPPIRRRSGLHAGGVATVLGPGGQDDITGVRILQPGDELAGARWVASRREAEDELARVLSHYAEQTVGEERLFRVQLLDNGAMVDDQIVVVGEVSAPREVLDSISLTYFGVLLGVSLAIGFGFSNAGWEVQLLLGLSSLVVLTQVTRIAAVRRFLVRLARGSLPGSFDD